MITRTRHRRRKRAGWQGRSDETEVLRTRQQIWDDIETESCEQFFKSVEGPLHLKLARSTLPTVYCARGIRIQLGDKQTKKAAVFGVYGDNIHFHTFKYTD